MERDRAFWDRFELITHFQPIVSIKKKTVIGFESLTRAWDRQENVPLSYADLKNCPKSGRQTSVGSQLPPMCLASLEEVAE